MDPTRTNPGCGYPSGGTQPRQLVAYYKNGSFHCPESGTPPLWNPSSNYQPANVRLVTNPANCSPTNNKWVWEVDGTTVHTEVDTLGFCSGKSISNGERLPPEDEAKSDFKGLKVLLWGGSWTAWSDAKVCYDNDGNFDNIFHSDTGHVAVDNDPPDDQDTSFCY